MGGGCLEEPAWGAQAEDSGYWRYSGLGACWRGRGMTAGEERWTPRGEADRHTANVIRSKRSAVSSQRTSDSSSSLCCGQRLPPAFHFAFSSVFTSWEVKNKPSGRSSLEAALHEEANATSVIGWKFASPWTVWQSRLVADKLIGLQSAWLRRTHGALVLAIVNIPFFLPVCWMQPQATGAEADTEWAGPCGSLLWQLNCRHITMWWQHLAGRTKISPHRCERERRQTDNKTDGNGTRRCYDLPPTHAWLISLQRRTLRLF